MTFNNLVGGAEFSTGGPGPLPPLPAGAGAACLFIILSYLSHHAHL